jgi:hypothetical protein
MFEKFSATFESTFRLIAISWIIVWSVINVLTYTVQFGTYANLTAPEKGEWLFKSLGSFIGFVLGVILIFMFISAGKAIAAGQKVTTATIITILSCIYFMIPTLADIFGMAAFNPTQFVEDLPKLIMWFLPSITLLIISIMYTSNLGKYNHELAATNSQN